MDVMLDIETLGTTPGSVIFALGAVAFSPHRDPIAWPEFYSVISIKSCLDAGLTKDQDTLNWWKAQAPEAREALTNAESPLAPDLKTVLQDFRGFLRKLVSKKEELVVWGNGSDFDNVLVASAFHAVDLSVIWSYKANRCFRTLNNLFPDQAIANLPAETAHNALQDAKNQAIAANAILEYLKSNCPSR